MVISPSGKQYEVGFLSPCTDGVIIGTTQIGNEPHSHLTILNKDDELSSHITPQNRLAKSQWFPPMTTNDLSIRVQTLLERKIIYQLSEEEQTEQVMYITQKLAEWYNTLIQAIYYQKVSKKEVIHVIDIKKGIETMPKLIETLKTSFGDFLGSCKANELLSDKTKIVGITNSKKLIIPIDGSLIGIDLNAFLGTNFVPSTFPIQANNPLTDVFDSLGVPQYIQQEIVEKRYLEKLFSQDERIGKTD